MRAQALEARCKDAEVGRKVFLAVEAFLEKDGDLLTTNAAERAVAHRFAHHLEEQFPGWHIDCEYNRLDRNTKKLQTFNGGQNVFPDVIVHRRLTTANHLVIEIKKTTNPEKHDDLAKLAAYLGELKYDHGLFLLFGAGLSTATLEEAIWA